MKKPANNIKITGMSSVILLIIIISVFMYIKSYAEATDIQISDKVITGSIHVDSDETMKLVSNYLQLTWDKNVYSYELSDDYLEISKKDDRFTYTFSLIAAKHGNVEDLREYVLDAMNDYYGEDNIRGNVLAFTEFDTSEEPSIRFVDSGVQHSTEERSIFSHVHGMADDKVAFVYALTIDGDGEDVLDFYQDNYEGGTDHELIDVEMGDLLQTMVLVTNR